MNIQGFQRRVLNPMISVLVIAGISYLGYYGSRHIGSEVQHQVLSTILGAIYFLSVIFGPFYIYITTYLRGATPVERVLASLLIPFLWMTKGVLVLTQSHPFLECLYWYFNPLYIWMACLISVEMGLGKIIAKAIQKRQGLPVKVITPESVVIVLLGLITFAAIFAWGQGENLYSLYLEGYRFLFGFGV